MHVMTGCKKANALNLNLDECREIRCLFLRTKKIPALEFSPQLPSHRFLISHGLLELKVPCRYEGIDPVKIHAGE